MSTIRRTLALALVVGLVAGACTSSNATSSSTVTQVPVTQAPPTQVPAASLAASVAASVAATVAPLPYTTPIAPLANCVVGHTSPDLQNPYYVSLHDALSSLLAQAGCTYIATDSHQKADQQLTDVENLIQRGVKVLLIDAVDTVAICPAFKAANKAGIPVLTLIREPECNPAVDYTSFIWFDSEAHGKEACQYIVDQLHGKGNVVNLQGTMSIAPGQLRSKGCLEAFSAAPGINVVASQPAAFDRVTAERVMTDILTAHPNIDAVFGANDEEALGVVKAFQEANIDPKTKIIVGIDGTQVAYDAICQGTMKATVATVSAVEGADAFGIIQQIMAGKTPPHKVQFFEDFVTKDNVVQIAAKSLFTTYHCP